MCDPRPDATLSRRQLLSAGTGIVAAAAFGVLPHGSSRSSPWSPSSPSRPTGTVPPDASRFWPLRPTRLLDTRVTGEWSRPDAGRLRIAVAGHAGVPATATAVAITVGMVGVASSGLVSVAPATDATGPFVTSLLDLGAPDASPDTSSHASSHTFLVGLGGGALDIVHAEEPEHLTVDVVGYFEPSGATAAGRVVTVEPTRIVDTTATANPFGTCETRIVQTGDACPDDAIAVAVNLTAIAPTRGGHWTAYPGLTPPSIWSLAVGSDETASTLVVVPLDRGAFRLVSSDGGHAAVDLVGYVTGDSAPVTHDGLFVPETPYRALDTRLVDQPIPAQSSRELSAGPPACSALAMSITAFGIDATGSGDGSAAVWPAGELPPTRSTVHLRDVGTPVSNFAVGGAGRRGMAVGPAGRGTHVVVDVYGWFTGERSDGEEPVLGAQPYGIGGIAMEAYADEWFDYGTSTDGRPLRAFRHGSGPRQALVTTGLHGDEHTGTSVLADLVTRPPIDGWTLWLVPIANPDARWSNARFVHDVDMNRDFPADWAALPSLTGSGCVTTRTGPAPHTLVESQHLAAAMTSGPFARAEVSISHHDNYNWVAPQVGSPETLRHLADDYALATGLRLPGEGGSVVPTSPRNTRVAGGFETFAHSLGMSSFLVENKAGYVAGTACAGSFGLLPLDVDVAPHHQALRALLTDARLP